MADDHKSNGMDMSAHEQTFGGFTALVKWGTIISLIVTALVIALLV